MMSTAKLVPTAKLKIDQNYQRELNEKRVDQMAREWKPELVAALNVSARNGSMYVIDGQHRLAAARKAGVEELPAIVYENLSPADEAGMFAALNTLRVRPQTSAIFRARLEARDQAAMDIRAAAVASGVTLNLVGGGTGRSDSTRSVAALEGLYRAGGSKLVRQTLTTLRQSWPEDHRAMESTSIYGVGSFIYVYQGHPIFNLERIAKKLGELPASAFLRRCSELTTASPGSGTSSGAGGIMGRPGPRRAVLEAFNRDLRSARLPDATPAELRLVGAGKNPWTKER